MPEKDCTVVRELFWNRFDLFREGGEKISQYLVLDWTDELEPTQRLLGDRHH